MSLLGAIGKIAKKAVAFIPGVGPLISTALDVGGSLLSKNKTQGTNNAVNAANQAAITNATNAANAGLAQQTQLAQGDQQVGALGRQNLASFLQPGATDPVTGALDHNALKTFIGGLTDPAGAKSFGAADFQADPGYAFRQAEGEKAIARNANAAGGQFSGATLKSLLGFNQGAASDEYQRAYTRFRDQQDAKFSKQTSLANLANGVYNQGFDRATTATGIGTHANDVLSGAIQGNTSTLADLAIGRGASNGQAIAGNGAASNVNTGNIIGSLQDLISGARKKNAAIPRIAMQPAYANGVG